MNEFLVSSWTIWIEIDPLELNNGIGIHPF